MSTSNIWKYFLVCLFSVGVLQSIPSQADSSWLGDIDYSPGRCTLNDADKSLQMAWKCPLGDRVWKHDSKDHGQLPGKLKVKVTEIKDGIIIQLTSKDKKAIKQLKAMAHHMKTEHSANH